MLSLNIHGTNLVTLNLFPSIQPTGLQGYCCSDKVRGDPWHIIVKMQANSNKQWPLIKNTTL